MCGSAARTLCYINKALASSDKNAALNIRPRDPPPAIHAFARLCHRSALPFDERVALFDERDLVILLSGASARRLAFG